MLYPVKKKGTKMQISLINDLIVVREGDKTLTIQDVLNRLEADDDLIKEWNQVCSQFAVAPKWWPSFATLKELLQSGYTEFTVPVSVQGMYAKKDEWTGKWYFYHPYAGNWAQIVKSPNYKPQWGLIRDYVEDELILKRIAELIEGE